MGGEVKNYCDRHDIMPCDCAWRLIQEGVEAKAENAALKRESEGYRRALERISHAKADRLDHSIDAAIVEKCAAVAKAALSSKANQ